MKICLINNLYKPFLRGGAEKVVLTMAEGFLSAGHEVFIITTKPYFSKLSALTVPGPKIYYLSSLYFNLKKFPKILRLIWHLWDMFNLLNYYKIKIILEIQKPDAVITNNLMGLGYLTGLAIKRSKTKQIHLVHDLQLIHPSGLICYGSESLIEAYFTRIYAGLSSQLFGSPPVVIFPSRWLMDRYLDKIFFVKSKRIVLPNPIALKPAAERPKSNDIFKFLYLGQIEKHKGLNILIRAFKKAKERLPRTELIIAGTGSELEKVKTESGQDDSIKFIGWQAEAQVDKLLRTCHSLVVPTSCYENCPAAILEAFSAGLPVIAADLGGISELIGETAGILFRPMNADDLAGKMIWAAENQDELIEIIKAGRGKAVLFKVENYIKKLEKLIKL